jgi:hypothetical protein
VPAAWPADHSQDALRFGDRGIGVNVGHNRVSTTWRITSHQLPHPWHAPAPRTASRTAGRAGWHRRTTRTSIVTEQPVPVCQADADKATTPEATVRSLWAFVPTAALRC